MSTEFNKTIVRRFFDVFEGVPEKSNPDNLDELLHKDFIFHRPDLPEPVIGLENLKRFSAGAWREVYSEFTTIIYEMIAEGDFVAIRARHRVVHSGELTSRLGRHAVAGKPATWEGMAIFRFRDGKIQEEWANRDELGMLLDLGVLSPDRSVS